MMESEGVLFHIDFGYLLGRTINFEKAPFKLTDEFLEVMGGDQSKLFKVRHWLACFPWLWILTFGVGLLFIVC